MGLCRRAYRGLERCPPERPDAGIYGNRRRTDAGKGLLENLWPYIDNDPELGRDALMTRGLDSMEMDGRLYQVCNSFTICTAYGLKSLMGDRTSIALDEVLELYKTLPSGSAILGFNSTPQDTLLQLASLDRLSITMSCFRKMASDPQSPLQ